MTARRSGVFVLSSCLLVAIGLGMLYAAGAGLQSARVGADAIDSAMLSEVTFIPWALFVACLTTAAIGRVMWGSAWQGITTGISLWGYTVFYGVRHGLLATSWDVLGYSVRNSLGTCGAWCMLLSLVASACGVLLGGPALYCHSVSYTHEARPSCLPWSGR